MRVFVERSGTDTNATKSIRKGNFRPENVSARVKKELVASLCFHRTEKRRDALYEVIQKLYLAWKKNAAIISTNRETDKLSINFLWHEPLFSL